ncbi:hypothetical protein FRC03_009038, partial [Tulasnella sp. 419]
MSEGPPFEKTAVWLARSREYPLDILLYAFNQNYVTNAIDLLSATTHRWRTFKFKQMGDRGDPEFTHDSIQSFFRELYNGSSGLTIHAPLLELFELEIGTEVIPDTLTLTPLSFDTPKLQRFYIHDVPVDWRRFSFTLQNVTDFYVDVMWRQCRATIGFRDVLVRDLASEAIPLLSGDMTSQIPIKLHCLERLEIYELSGPCSELWFWLGCIEAPNLRELEIHHRYDWNWVAEGDRESTLDDEWLRPQFPALKHFIWAPWHACPHFLPRLFKVAPSISQLMLTKYSTLLDAIRDFTGSPLLFEPAFIWRRVCVDNWDMKDGLTDGVKDAVLKFAVEHPDLIIE